MSAKAEISSCILNLSEMVCGRSKLDVRKTVLRTGGVVEKPALSSFTWHGHTPTFLGVNWNVVRLEHFAMTISKGLSQGEEIVVSRQHE